MNTKQISQFQLNDKKSEVIESPNGFIINFYQDGELVHKRMVQLSDNPLSIAEDYVYNGDSAPKLLRE